MARRVVIVGDLVVRPDRKELLRTLAERAPAIEWDFVQAEDSGFNLPWKPFARLLNDIGASRNDPFVLTVVKLECLGGKDQGKLYRACPDPVLAPRSIQSEADLLEWLLSPDARLLVTEHPVLRVRAATVLAIFTKLVKNKSWCKDIHGHTWTTEANLLGQSPVRRSDIPTLANEAPALLARGADSLFITKGSNQGRTPKEWCINTRYLPRVKQCLLGRTLAPLAEEPDLARFVAHVEAGRDEEVEIDELIVSESALVNCIDARRKD